VTHAAGNVSGMSPIGVAAPAGRAAPGAADAPAGGFAGLLREQLERVNAAQGEADAKLQQVLTGESHDLTGVFTAARKAQVAFTLLMEIRNKLVEAYQELQSMRV
jgi:flagellar hook-basal body complex protein FliE